MKCLVLTAVCLLLWVQSAAALITTIGGITTGTSSGTTCTVSTLPSGTSIGDYLVGVVYGPGGSGQTITASPTMTVLGNSNTTAGGGQWFLGTGLGSVPSQVTFTITTGNNIGACHLRDYRGVDTTPTKDPVSSNPQSANASSTTASVTGLTTVNTGDLLLFSAVFSSNSCTLNSFSTPTAPTTWSRGQFASFSTGGEEGWDNIWTGSGATGTVSTVASITGSCTSQRNTAMLLILQAAAAVAASLTNQVINP